MVDYRIYERAGSFDGLTDETAIYRQNRFLYTTSTSTPVGQFPPASIGRVNTASLVLVRCDSVPAPLDVVEVLSPLGAVRRSVPLALASNDNLFLEPNDKLRIFAPTVRSVQILVNDLTDEQLSEYMSQQAAAEVIAAGSQVAMSLLLVGGTIALSPPASDLVVVVATGGAATITLPPVEAVPLGRRIIFERAAPDSGPPGPPKIVPASPASDLVNGMLGANEYFLLRGGDSVTYLRVPGGWQYARGVSAVNRLESAALINTAPVQKDGTLYATLTTAGADLALANVFDDAVAARVVLSNQSAGDITATPSGGQTINGIAGPLTVAPGAVVLLENTGAGWLAIAPTDPSPSVTTTGAAVFAVPPWHGTSMVIGTSGAQLFTLPAAATVKPSDVLVILNNSAVGSNVAPALGESINGIFASRGLFTRGAIVLRSNGTNGWAAVGGSSAPNLLSTAASVVLGTWLDGPQTVVMTGGAVQTITLPPSAQMWPGATAVVLNSTAGAHDVAASAGDDINGGPNLVIPLGQAAMFTLGGGSSTWIAV